MTDERITTDEIASILAETPNIYGPGGSAAFSISAAASGRNEPAAPNYLRTKIIKDRTKVRITMAIDGDPKYWIDYDLNQLETLIKLLTDAKNTLTRAAK